MVRLMHQYNFLDLKVNFLEFEDFRIYGALIPLNATYYIPVLKCNFCRQGYLPARDRIPKGNIHKYVRWEKNKVH